jgi:sec-independent protein translocase protein TatA
VKAGPSPRIKAAAGDAPGKETLKSKARLAPSMFLPPVLLFGNVGTAEVIFILVLVLLLFGAQKIPDLARSLGKAQREFNRARQEFEEDRPAKLAETDDERLRRAARDLGIEVEGKTMEQVRAAIAEKVKA